MGLLAESKSRRRIQNDPNNTRWTRDTTTFGQKMLRSQGWEPGQLLGAKDAAHSEFHTAANASYIRVSLKDDMKGLGYSKSKEDEVTGLDIFSDLLSRLNGKSEAEVEEKRQARLEVRMHQYVEQKWGPMRFVRGGLLVGDNMEEENDSSEESESSTAADDKIPTATKESKKEKSNKRKAEALKDDDEMSDDEDDEKKKKKQRKEERRAKKFAKSDSTQSSDSEKAKKKKEKKEKKEKKKSKKDKALAEEEADEDAMELDGALNNSSSASNSGPEKEKSSKKEKKGKREKKEKKDKKDKDKKKRKKNDTSDTEMPDASSTLASRSGTATPITTGTSTPTTKGNFVTPRSRFIAQKRAAFMDAQALNQIFMVKA
ncbi:uncharacterized protein TRIVIDRAFT_231883 [Trichoderma virens Gv29-8]|uniref:PinX1-related protein 1 n=1 Tax=Hypocrea virens (strain Gv29-8 / FGSC 10586) TaxID=413071 RepID=G9N768_HYPVG|nr:uncharacterized protein TRIVIDRAFT_231883 [Trichoderma virens Gv29-8]EHK17566.1 hypothetical protein TRIVIDRAFT_231883 [Trichoderma virens Gv29-8]UKZ53714.1 hypothetical protein TrVGV298_007511 [Trichoderma virens]